MRSIASLIFIFLLLVQSAPNIALTYLARIDVAEWQLQKSPLECRLTQPIPNFGEAVFFKRSGEPVGFQLATNEIPLSEGVAQLIATAPPWRPDATSLTLGEVEVKPASPAIDLPRSLAARLLAELQRGMSPTFANLQWNDEDSRINVGMSAVNFQAAFGDYQQCLATMVPVSFVQIERSRMEFRHNSVALDVSMRQRLDWIAQYVLADDEVSGCFVDGHTDNSGNSRYNVHLSKKRAESVVAYLVSRGVPKKRITTRYHGDRFPVSPNSDEDGRSKNRRVTVRLAR